MHNNRAWYKAVKKLVIKDTILEHMRNEVLIKQEN